MARAGRVHARCLKMLAAKCRPGVTTAELDEAAEKFIRSQGATPTFKGYRGFPGSICASPNAMVVHGIPDAYALQRGDVLSIDVGVTKDGWVADGAITVADRGGLRDRPGASWRPPRPRCTPRSSRWRPGNRLSDVSHAVQIDRRGTAGSR